MADPVFRDFEKLTDVHQKEVSEEVMRCMLILKPFTPKELE